MAEDERVARHACECAHPPEMDFHGGQAGGCGILSGGRAPRAEAGDFEVVERRAARRVS
jgi:hypothetical protein